MPSTGRNATAHSMATAEVARVRQTARVKDRAEATGMGAGTARARARDWRTHRACGLTTCTQCQPFNSTLVGVDSIPSARLHVRRTHVAYV